MNIITPEVSAKIDKLVKDVYTSTSNYESENAKNEIFVNKNVRPVYKKLRSSTNTSTDSNNSTVSAAVKFSQSNKNKLIQVYQEVIGNLEQEEECLRSALKSIYSISETRTELRLASRSAGNKETIRRGALMKMLSNSARNIPLFVPTSSRGGERPPQLCGAIPPDPGYVAKPGDMAAALVKSDGSQSDKKSGLPNIVERASETSQSLGGKGKVISESDDSENWILTEITNFFPGGGGGKSDGGKYEVDDIDEEEKERHLLTKKHVIPLPTKRASPQTNPEALHPKGTIVMALYPQTTCFYKGVIKQTPLSASDDYLVMFEDNSYMDGFSPPLPVAQRYVILHQSATTTSSTVKAKH